MTANRTVERSGRGRRRWQNRLDLKTECAPMIASIDIVDRRRTASWGQDSLAAFLSTLSPNRVSSTPCDRPAAATGNRCRISPSFTDPEKARATWAPDAIL